MEADDYEVYAKLKEEIENGVKNSMKCIQTFMNKIFV